MVEDPKKTIEEMGKAQKSYNDLLNGTIALIKKIKDSRTEEKAIVEAIKKEEKEVLSLQREKIGLVEEENIKNKERVKLFSVEQKAIDQKIKDHEKLIERLRDEEELLKSQGKLTKEEFDRLEKKQVELGKSKKTLQEIKKLNEEDLEKAKKTEALQRLQTNFFKEAIHHLGITSHISEGWLGSTEQILHASMDISATMSNIGKFMGDALHPANLFQNAVSFTVESTLAMSKEMDHTLASFNKATGAGGKFNQVIDQTRFGSLEAGVGLQESANAVQALFENYTNFNQLSSLTQVELSRTTAELDRMGISAVSAAQAMDISTKALGMNVTEAMNAQKEIAAEALALGLSPGKLADEFTHSLPSLAQYGKQSVQIFKSLATQSKATGIAIGELIGISQQFDTFKGAAEAAGKLNAILGGNLLNSVELLSANESERIDMLRQSISLSGRNFNELSKFDKMAIASAAGIKDLNEASRLFGTSAEQFDNVRRAQEEEALSTKNLTKYAANATSAQEKLKKAIEGLSGASLPLLNIVVKLLDAFLYVNDVFGGYLAPVLLAFTGTLYAFSKVMLVINALTAAWSAITTFATGVLGLFSLAKDLDTEATVANTVATEVGVVATKAKIAGDILARIAGMALVPVLGAATAAQWLLNIALNANPIGLVVISIGILIVTIVLLTKHYDELQIRINKMTGGFLDFWDVLLLMMGPITWIIEFGKRLYETWKDVTSVFSDLYSEMSGGKSVLDGWSNIVSGLEGMFFSLSSTVKSVFSGIWDLVKSPINIGIKGVNTVIDKMNTYLPMVHHEYIPELASGISNFHGGVAMVGEEGPELVSLPHGSNVLTNENTSRLSQAGQRYKTARTEQDEKRESPPSPAVERASQATTQKSNDNGNRTLVMEIDGRELGKVMFNIFNDRMKLNALTVG